MGTVVEASVRVTVGAVIGASVDAAVGGSCRHLNGCGSRGTCGSFSE